MSAIFGFADNLPLGIPQFNAALVQVQPGDVNARRPTSRMGNPAGRHVRIGIWMRSHVEIRPEISSVTVVHYRGFWCFGVVHDLIKKIAPTYDSWQFENVIYRAKLSNYSRN